MEKITVFTHRLDLAVRLAQFYGVSLDYLVGLTDVKAPYPPNPTKP